MLQNAYLGAKIGFDAEENEPSKVWSFCLRIGVKFGIESFNPGAAHPHAPQEGAAQVHAAGRRARREGAEGVWPAEELLAVEGIPSIFLFFPRTRLRGNGEKA